MNSRQRKKLAKQQARLSVWSDRRMLGIPGMRRPVVEAAVDCALHNHSPEIYRSGMSRTLSSDTADMAMTALSAAIAAVHEALDGGRLLRAVDCV